MRITVELPYPPSTNNLFVNKVQGGRSKSLRYRVWIRDATAALQQALIGHRFWNHLFDGWVSVSIVCHAEDRRRRDISNVIKSIEDLLVKQRVIRDDSLVEELHVKRDRTESVLPGHCLVVVESMHRPAATAHEPLEQLTVG